MTFVHTLLDNFIYLFDLLESIQLKMFQITGKKIEIQNAKFFKLSEFEEKLGDNFEIMEDRFGDNFEDTLGDYFENNFGDKLEDKLESLKHYILFVLVLLLSNLSLLTDT